MAYRVLARKYRPQTFEEVIGQEHVTVTLTNALKQNKVAHAYLFSGPRGVGKTTIARILAKCLNCEKGPTPTPCNSCDGCRRIAEGQELVDVLEMDAATNRGIEEIRELRDHVRYAPAKSRYKVFIVDEAHQITTDAFNAFLKTLEEPPEHAVFILATTEHQKIPLTILSRCQFFRFKRVALETLVERLETILKSEKRAYETPALERLAKASGGSVRDSLSLLDQALSYTTDALTVSQVDSLLGFLPEEALAEFVGLLVASDAKPVVAWIEKLLADGWDATQFVRDFREFLRVALIRQAEQNGQSVSFKDQTVPMAQVLQWLRVYGQCLDAMKWSDHPRLELELYTLRLLQPFVDVGELIQRIGALEQNPGSVASRSVSASFPSPTAAAKTSVTPPAPRVSKPTASVSDVPAAPPAIEAISAPISASGSLVDPASIWKQLLHELWKRPTVGAAMERAVLKSATAQEWVIAFPDAFALSSADRGKTFIQECLVKLAGSAPRLRFSQEALTPEEEVSVVVPRAVSVKEKAAMEDPNVQKVLQAFKGKLRVPDEPSAAGEEAEAT